MLVVLLVLNSLLAAARSALVGASRARLRQMVEKGVAGARLALRVADDATPLIATIRLTQTATRFLAAGLIALVFEPTLARLIASWPSLSAQAEPLALFLLMLLAGLLVVAIGELLPEAWVLRNPEKWAVIFAVPIGALEWLLSPLVRLVLYAASRLAAPLAGRQLPFVTEEEIKTMVDAGEEGGVIEVEEKEMIYSIFELGDTIAREIMVPRIDVLALDISTPLPEAVDAVLSAGHSRIPIFQGTIDNVLGLLYAKDLLRAWKDGSQASNLRDLLRPAYFAPETKKVAELLADLQQKRIHLAVVVDEYGATLGIVTLEDVIEEIVGEIEDEFDQAEPSAFVIEGANFRTSGLYPMHELREKLKLPKMDAEGVDTLGGYITQQLGRWPRPGDAVLMGNFVANVQTVLQKRRVGHVLFTPKAPGQAEGNGKEAEVKK